MSLLGHLEELPEDFKSRKVLLIVLTMVIVLLLAFIGTVIVALLGADGSLLHEAMQLILAAGGLGTVSQAVPDSIQAGKGQYRPQQIVTSSTIAPPYTPPVNLSNQAVGPKSMFGG